MGGFHEDHLPQSNLGETFSAIVFDTFRRKRGTTSSATHMIFSVDPDDIILVDGDRFWYEREFNGTDLESIYNTTFADIIAWNSNIPRS